MALTIDVYNRLTAFITEKIGRIRPCPVCGQDTSFHLLNDLVNLSFSDSTTSFALGGTYATHLVLVCGKCGNSHFLNVNVLGVLDILNGPSDDAVQSELNKIIRGDSSA